MTGGIVGMEVQGVSRLERTKWVKLFLRTQGYTPNKNPPIFHYPPMLYTNISYALNH